MREPQQVWVLVCKDHVSPPYKSLKAAKAALKGTKELGACTHEHTIQEKTIVLKW